MSRRIYIMRHGMRLDMEDRNWYRRAERPHDSPLSDWGFEMARESASFLADKDIHHVIASPFLRTVQTAHEIADLLDLPIKLERGICEWLNPEWFDEDPEHASHEELLALYERIDPEHQFMHQVNYPEPGWDSLHSRCQACLEKLMSTYEGNILLVGHGASMLSLGRALIAETAMTLPWRTACIIEIVENQDDWVLGYHGDAHLSRPEIMTDFYEKYDVSPE